MPPFVLLDFIDGPRMITAFRHPQVRHVARRIAGHARYLVLECPLKDATNGFDPGVRRVRQVSLAVADNPYRFARHAPDGAIAEHLGCDFAPHVLNSIEHMPRCTLATSSQQYAQGGHAFPVLPHSRAMQQSGQGACVDPLRSRGASGATLRT